MSKYRRNEVDVVDAIQVEFNTPREELRAFDKHVMVSPDWNAFDQWIMLPSGEREFCFGDWIVRSETGNLWFCEAETFAANYTRFESYRLVDSDAYYVEPREDIYLGGAVAMSAGTHGVATFTTAHGLSKDTHLGGTAA